MTFSFPSFEGFPVDMGVTTRGSPLFLSGIPDLENPKCAAALQQSFPLFRYWAYPEQIHGSHVKFLSERVLQKGPRFQKIAGTDGLLTDAPDSTLSILTADCLPIFFLVPDPLTIGLAHVGWRGSAGMIAYSAVARLQWVTRQSPKTFRVSFGPCIRACCYQVGTELQGLFPESITTRDHIFCLDLVKENRRQLEGAGVKEGNIQGDPPCTACHPEHFYSYRREKEKAGRMVSWIRIKSVVS